MFIIEDAWAGIAVFASPKEVIYQCIRVEITNIAVNYVKRRLPWGSDYEPT